MDAIARVVISKMYTEHPRRTMIDVIKILLAWDLQLVRGCDAENGIRELLKHDKAIRLLFDTYMELTNDEYQYFDYSSIVDRMRANS